MQLTPGAGSPLWPCDVGSTILFANADAAVPRPHLPIDLFVGCIALCAASRQEG